MRDHIVTTLIDVLGASESQADALRDDVFDALDDTQETADRLAAWITESQMTLYPSVEAYEADWCIDPEYTETMQDAGYGVLAWMI